MCASEIVLHFKVIFFYIVICHCRYTEAIVDDEWLIQRKENPEVTWSGRELELLQAMSLMDKLQHVVTSQVG